jgi:hypothetical protein
MVSPCRAMGGTHAPTNGRNCHCSHLCSD